MRTIHAVLLVAVLVLTGCGGDGGGDEAVQQTTEPSPTAVAEVETVTPPENPKDEAGLEVDLDPNDDDPIEAEEDPSAPDDDPLELEPEDDTAEPTGPPTEGLPGGRYVQIDTVTASGSAYAVEFTPYNFVPLIGSGDQDFHIHFFWDIYPADTVGLNAPGELNDWEVWDTAPDGTFLFTAFGPGNQPFGATQICAVVATHEHFVDQIEIAELTKTCAPTP